jgi:putative transposase
VADVAEKDPGAGLERLSNREKTTPVDRLRPMLSPDRLARGPMILLSGHHYHHARAGCDAHSDIRARVRAPFKEPSSRYGCRELHHAPGVRLSGKVMRRIMRQEVSAARIPHRKRHGSYRGETAPAPDNLIHRDLHAKEPNGKWPAGITEIKACDGKVHVSPMIDCRDGTIVAHTLGLRPSARPADTIPGKAVATPPDDSGPIVHPDRGCRRRWPGWPRPLRERGVIRSMGRKGRFPNNPAEEGVLGRMRTEAVCPGHREQPTCRQAVEHIDTHMHRHSHEHIKQSPGWNSPISYRMKQGPAA